MRDKQFKKILKEEFEKNNKCPVELSDVLPEENFKNLSDNLYNKYKKQQRLSKRFSITSLITVLVLIVSVIGFSIKIVDYRSKLENSPVLSDEARDYMIEYCDGVERINNVCIEYISEGKYVAIYSNEKYVNEKKHIVYFYETSLLDRDILFTCNDIFEFSNNKNPFGFVYDFGVESSEIIELEIKTEEGIRKLVIN